MRASSSVIASVATALLYVCAANAYTVLEPTNSTGWTVGGPNTFSWTRVDTDPQNFTLVLDNQNQFPEYTQVLDALVVGTQNPMSITVNPPSGGFKTGAGYRVNVVADAQHLSSILVQSDMFTISAGGSSSSGGSVSATSTGSATILSVPGSSQAEVSTTAPGASSSSSAGLTVLNPSGSDTSTSPSGSPNAAVSNIVGAQGTLFGVLALLGVFLA